MIKWSYIFVFLKSLINPFLEILGEIIKLIFKIKYYHFTHFLRVNRITTQKYIIFFEWQAKSRCFFGSYSIISS